MIEEFYKWLHDRLNILNSLSDIHVTPEFLDYINPSNESLLLSISKEAGDLAIRRGLVSNYEELLKHKLDANPRLKDSLV